MFLQQSPELVVPEPQSACSVGLTVPGSVERSFEQAAFESCDLGREIDRKFRRQSGLRGFGRIEPVRGFAGRIGTDADRVMRWTPPVLEGVDDYRVDQRIR